MPSPTGSSSQSLLRPMGRRCIHSSAPCHGGSPFFALGALANSRETQHFQKASRLSRIEHSPTLEQIRESEVKPFDIAARAKVQPRVASTVTTVGQASRRSRSRAAVRITPVSASEALCVGRTVLRDNARRLAGLNRSKIRARLGYEKVTRRLLAENRKLVIENRSAMGVVLATILVVTGLAVFRSQPARVPHWPRDASPLAAGLDETMPIHVAEPGLQGADNVLKVNGFQEEEHETGIGSRDIPAAVTSLPAAQLSRAEVQQAGEAVLVESASQPWWRSLFWKASG